MWHAAEDCSNPYSGDWKSSVAVGWESGVRGTDSVCGGQTSVCGATATFAGSACV